MKIMEMDTEERKVRKAANVKKAIGLWNLATKPSEV